jgi:hypothetical protein
MRLNDHPRDALRPLPGVGNGRFILDQPAGLGLILQRAGDVNDGYQLQRTDAKGEGVFATRSFQVGETVMVGVIEGELDHNHAHASQISQDRFVLHGADGHLGVVVCGQCDRVVLDGQ